MQIGVSLVNCYNSIVLTDKHILRCTLLLKQILISGTKSLRYCSTVYDETDNKQNEGE